MLLSNSMAIKVKKESFFSKTEKLQKSARISRKRGRRASNFFGKFIEPDLFEKKTICAERRDFDVYSYDNFIHKQNI